MSVYNIRYIKFFLKITRLNRSMFTFQLNMKLTNAVMIKSNIWRVGRAVCDCASQTTLSFAVQGEKRTIVVILSCSNKTDLIRATVGTTVMCIDDRSVYSSQGRKGRGFSNRYAHLVDHSYDYELGSPKKPPILPHMERRRTIASMELLRTLELALFN